MKIVVTGGAGFIGSNFVHHLLRSPDIARVVVIDKLTYAGNLRNLEDARRDQRFGFVRMDICDPAVREVVAGNDAIVHFAAESHVDRSIEDAIPFVHSNVEGTWRLVESCRAARVPRFIHVSTDEVYGSLGAHGRFTEQTPLAPTSPYAASKAASDLLVLSAVKTYGFPAIVTRCSNNYGPYQFPEKFIPLMIAQAMAGAKLPIYGDGRNVRDWIYVADHCSALEIILRRGREGEIYNVGGESEMENLAVARQILRALGCGEELLEFVLDRPAHDRRYAMDCGKIKGELAWSPAWSFDRGLQETIRWYRLHADWLQAIRNGEYRQYFDRHYGQRRATLAAAVRS
jgi:dTDP-glucose 4,6-dehydratase